MSLGSILKFQRKTHGISQLDLAEKLHVSRQSISSWENDRSYPSIDNLISLSELYKLSIDDLLKDNEELREKIERNQKRIQEYKGQLDKLNETIKENKEPEFGEYDKKDEFLFCLTLILISIILLPIGPILPICYFIVKRQEKKKKESEKKSNE